MVSRDSTYGADFEAMLTNTAEAAFAEYMDAKRAHRDATQDELDSIDVTTLIRRMAEAKDAYVQAVRVGASAQS